MSFDVEIFLKNLTTSPGVYHMIGQEGEVLYVGKAKNLKNRVSSYFRGAHNRRITSMVSQIEDIQVTATHTETEALILEDAGIKSHRPKYNVLLRDDKSYPYIFISTKDTYPRLSFYRGARKKDGRYFGPYPSSHAVRETLQVLQKVFQVRQCEDSYFANRTRPCLQYQIKRCTAPCVDYITPENYAEDVAHTVSLLEGKSQTLIEALGAKMESASQSLNFEKAATYRDQIQNLRTVMEKQYVAGGEASVDVIAMSSSGVHVCVHINTIRDGRHLGGRSYFPRVPKDTDENEALSSFLTQFYFDRDTPHHILIAKRLDEQKTVEAALSERAGHRVKLSTPQRGEKTRWLELAQKNAHIALTSKLNIQGLQGVRLEALKERLNLDQVPHMMECFDISHTQGEATVASCVVFKDGEPFAEGYRRYNIEGIIEGDDYDAMRQVLSRRFEKVKAGQGKFPDVIFIDGGKGQISAAVEVFEALDVLTQFTLVGVAKGISRKPGEETLILPETGETMDLPATDNALHLIQYIRDEAHRFAITGHRAKRNKKRQTSTLESIAGVGTKRRQNLLKHFGGLQGVKKAGVEDLRQVQGISAELAQTIYDTFHE